MLNLIRPRSHRTKRVWAAGGVVCRPDNIGGIEVVIVGRTDELLWTLPKGTPEPGEPVEYTAIREVAEETGLEVQPISHIRVTSHVFFEEHETEEDQLSSTNPTETSSVKVHKTVHWYLMHAVGGDLTLHDDEFDEVRWVHASDAVKMMTYGNQKRLIDEACYRFRRVMEHRDSIRLTTGNTTVRSKRPTDAWNEYCWRSDPELSALDATAPIALPFDQFQRVFASRLRREKPRSLHLSIDDELGNHIGNCMCYDIDKSKRMAEFGIMIGKRNYWNKGYGADATRLLMHHALTKLPIDTLFLHTLATNYRAQTAFKNAGFRPVGNISKGNTEFIKMIATASDIQPISS